MSHDKPLLTSLSMNNVGSNNADKDNANAYITTVLKAVGATAMYNVWIKTL